MEGLVLLLAGVIELVAVVVPLMLEAVVLLVSGAGELIGLSVEAAASRRQRPLAGDPSTATESPAASAIDWPKVRAVSRKTMWVSGALLGVTFLGIAIANLFVFEPIMRWAVSDLKDDHGLKVKFDEAEGNLFTGRVELHGTRLTRDGHDVSNFNLTFRTVEADIHLLRLWRGELVFEDAAFQGVRGTYERVSGGAEKPPGRGFRAGRFFVADAEVLFRDTSRPEAVVELPVVIDRLETVPLVSASPVFSMLFRSNASGRIGDGTFTLTTAEVSGGRETTWEAEDLPMHVAAVYLGAPFNWMTAGRLDVHVVDRWSLDGLDVDQAKIDMDWNLTLKDIQAEVPEDLSAPMRIIATPTVSYLNNHPHELPLGFAVTLSEGTFSGRMTLPLEELGKVVGAAALDALAHVADVPKQAVQDAGRGVLDFFRGREPEENPGEPEE